MAGFLDMFSKKKKDEEEDLLEGLESQNIMQQNVNLPMSPQLNPQPQFQPTSPPNYGFYQSQEQPQFTQSTIETQQEVKYDYSQYGEYYQYDWESYIQEIAEKVVDEKMKYIDEKLVEFRIWRERMELELTKIKETLNNLSSKVDNLYDTIAKKISEYDKGLKEAATEIQALHKVIRTMIPAISESTKELRETVEEIKLLRDKLRTP